MPKPVHDHLEMLPYAAITLTDGHLKRMRDTVKADLLRIPNDDLLKGFRIRAGLPAPGKDLGGWYTSDTFHIFGQLLSALARFAAADHDAACRGKLDALIRGWAATIRPDGYFFYTDKPNTYHYTYEKMVGGLVDAIVFTKSFSAKRHLATITDWAEKHLDRTRPYGADAAEWYTLSENLYRAADATGDDRYRRFAQVWEYTRYWDAFAANQNIHALSPSYHAYSHVNTLCGAAMAYNSSGDKHYLATIRNAFVYLTNTQFYSTGGFGPDESLIPSAERRTRVETTHNTFETQCGTWACFKFTRYLHRFTGTAHYADWTEKLIWNGLAASIPTSPDGRVFYYADYNPGGAIKTLYGAPYPCCAGTRPMAAADLPSQIAMQTPAGDLAILQFIPSIIRTKNGTLRISTTFPESKAVHFQWSGSYGMRQNIKIRLPKWAAGLPHLKNDATGKNMPVLHDKSGHWLIIRQPLTGDMAFTLTLPLRFMLEAFDSAKPFPVTLMYGPIALTLRSEKPFVPKLTALRPSDGEALTWHVAGHPDALVRAFHLIPEGEPYRLLLDPDARQQVHHSQLTYTGQWQNPGPWHFSNEVGASISYTFTGTGIKWLGYRFDDGGFADILINDKPAEMPRIDQFGPGRQLPFEYQITGLARTRHTITIRLAPGTPAGSKDHFLNIAGFEIIY